MQAANASSGCGDHRHREMCGDGYEQSSSCGKTSKCSREKSELRTDAEWFCVLRTGIGGPHRTSCPAGLPFPAQIMR